MPATRRPLLEARADLRILGLDQDPDALAAAQARLAPFGDRSTAVHARFDQLADGGRRGRHRHPTDRRGPVRPRRLSSAQLDRPERGFSYRHDAPLDMRMDRAADRSAADLVNTSDEHDLAAILRRNGDERFAARIARAIVAARPVTTTGQLAELVVGAIPAPARRKGGHPAKRTFQALRIDVNEELEVLPPALDAAFDARPGGRLVVISYHSGEDRIVKDRFRRADDGRLHLPARPAVRAAVPRPRPGCSSGAAGRRTPTRSPPTLGPPAPASGRSRSCPTDPDEAGGAR